MKCQSCAAALAFDPASGKVHCDHCGRYYEVEELSPVNDDSVQSDSAYIGQDIYTCSSCGARVIVNDVESATYCIYCEQPAIVFSRVSHRKQPQSIVPFSITKEQAHEIIRRRTRRGRAVPDSVKNFSPDMVRGIYIPFQKSDVDFRSKNLVKSVKAYNLWTLLVGIWGTMILIPGFHYSEGRAEFHDVTVDASSAFNDKSAHLLEPYDLTKRKPFHVGYMLGFYGDCYDEGGRTMDVKMGLRCKELYEEELTRKTTGIVEVTESNYRSYVQNDEYMMLPVWFAIFHENDQHYTLMVNGQTGKVVGTLPFDQKKALKKTISLSVFFCLLPILVNLIYSFDKLTDPYFWSDISFNMMMFLPLLMLYPIPLILILTRVLKKVRTDFESSLGLTLESAIKHLAADRQGKEKLTKEEK